MMPVDDSAEAVILRWPKPQQELKPKRRTIRQRLNWLAFPIWGMRLVAELVGWVAVVGLITQ